MNAGRRVPVALSLITVASLLQPGGTMATSSGANCAFCAIGPIPWALP